MLYIVLFIWMLLWTGFATMGLDQPLWGGFHWAGIFLIGSLGCFFAMLKAIFD